MWSDRMNFKGKLLSKFFCNLMQIIAGAFGQWGEFIPKPNTIPKGFRIAEFNPVVEFGLGPFESLNDHLYRSNYYVRGVDFNNKRIREKITRMSTEEKKKEEEDKQVERMKTDYLRISKFENKKISGRLKNKTKTLSSKPNQSKIVKTHLHLVGRLSSKQIKALRNELKTIKNQIKIFRKLSDLLRQLEKNFIEFKKKLSVKSAEISEESEKKITDNEGKKAINENKMANENWKFDGSGFKAMNNVTYNNQYQIDAIFIINRLSEEKEKTDLKFNEYKELGGEIFNELTVRKMKELLVQTLNNLNSGGIPVGDFPNGKISEIDLIKDIEKNFSKTSPEQTITPKQINQLSRIIDFVERYHGTLSGFKDLSQPGLIKNLESLNAEKTLNSKQKTEEVRKHRKVLHNQDLFSSVASDEPSLIRRKGSFLVTNV